MLGSPFYQSVVCPRTRQYLKHIQKRNMASEMKLMGDDDPGGSWDLPVPDDSDNNPNGHRKVLVMSDEGCVPPDDDYSDTPGSEPADPAGVESRPDSSD